MRRWGSRGGKAITVTHVKATSMSALLTPFAWEAVDSGGFREGGIGAQAGVNELLREETLRGVTLGWLGGRRRSVLAASYSVTAPLLYGAFPVMLLPFN